MRDNDDASMSSVEETVRIQFGPAIISATSPTAVATSCGDAPRGQSTASFATERGLVPDTRRWRGSATVPKRHSTRANGTTRRQRSNRPVRAHPCRMPQDPDVDADHREHREHRHNKHGDGMADRTHHAAHSE